MHKRKFLLKLKRALFGCPPSEIRNHLAFYSEIIDDRVEDGLTEKEAVLEIGKPEEIAKEIRLEISERPKKEKRPLGTGAKVLILLGSPIWLSLGIAAAAIVFSLAISAFAVVFSVFVCLFAALISLYAVVLSLGVSGLACIAGGAACLFTGRFTEMLIALGAGFVLAAVCIWLFLVCAPIGNAILRGIGNTWDFAVRIVLKRRSFE